MLDPDGLTVKLTVRDRKPVKMSICDNGLRTPATIEWITGNFNALIRLRVKDVATAELLTNQLREVHSVSTAVSSSVSDTNDPGEFTGSASRNRGRIAPKGVRMEPTDPVQLSRGQAFAPIHGGQLHKIPRMPLPCADQDSVMLPASMRV